jgi:hypothetical protein
MDWGQIILVCSRLVLGAAAAFFAILLWSKTRDTPWMLIAAGTLTAYVEIVYSMAEHLGFSTVPLAAILLTTLRMIFFTVAFLIMVVRRKT